MTPYDGPLDLDRLKSFLQLMKSTRESGTIETIGRDFHRTFYLDIDSVRVQTQGARKCPDLGELLVLRGKITPDQLRMCHDSQKRLRIRFDEVLSVLDIMPVEEVRDETMGQIEEELCEAFTWPDVRLKLSPQPPAAVAATPGQVASTYTLDALELATELVRRIDEWHAIQRTIPDLGAAPQVTPEGRKYAAAAKRKDPLADLLRTVDGKKSAETILQASPLPRFEVRLALYLLYSQGYLEIPGARRGDLSTVSSVTAPPAAAADEVEHLGTTGFFKPDAQGRRPAVLVVEDLAHIRRIIAFELDRAGLQVYEASSGREGLDLLENLQIDSVILDLMMPGMDGLQVCREIRSHPTLSRLPILMLTARTRSDAIAQMLTAGATDYLFKPYKREQLIEKVTTILRKK